MTVPVDPPDEDDVARLAWHPADFVDGKLLGSAFSSDDLLGKIDRDGKPRFVSVDQRSIISKAAVDRTIERQSAKDPVQRKDSKFAIYPVGHMRALEDDRAHRPFKIEKAELIDNKAHCALRTILNGRGRSYVDELRTLLVDNCREVLDYSDVFPE